MNKEYKFKIQTNEDYYTKLLKIKRNSIIGRTWAIWTFGALMSISGLFLLLAFFVLDEVSPSFEVYLGVLVMGYFVYRTIVSNKELKEEYKDNLSKAPSIFLATISQNHFLINENGEDTAVNWNDYNGFEKNSEGIVLGFSDARLLFLENKTLPNDKKVFLDLLKSKEQNT